MRLHPRHLLFLATVLALTLPTLMFASQLDTLSEQHAGSAEKARETKASKREQKLQADGEQSGRERHAKSGKKRAPQVDHNQLVETIRLLNDLREQVDTLRAEVERLRSSQEATAQPSSDPADAVYNRIDLSGTWSLTLPAGFQFPVTLASKSDGSYYLENARNLGGTYQQEGRLLKVTAPDQERLTGFLWRLETPDVAVLVEGPEVSKVGSDYRGAVLRRLSGSASEAATRFDLEQ